MGSGGSCERPRGISGRGRAEVSLTRPSVAEFQNGPSSFLYCDLHAAVSCSVRASPFTLAAPMVSKSFVLGPTWINGSVVLTKGI